MIRWQHVWIYIVIIALLAATIVWEYAREEANSTYLVAPQAVVTNTTL